MKKKIFACITQILYIMKQHKNTHLLILYQVCLIVKYLQKLVEKYTEYQMMITYSINIFYIFYILVIFNNDDFKYYMQS